MTVTDHDRIVDPNVEDRLRREFASSTWFALAAATAKAHHAFDDLPSPRSPGCNDDERREVQDRHLVLDQLLAEQTGQVCHGGDV